MNQPLSSAAWSAKPAVTHFARMSEMAVLENVFDPERIAFLREKGQGWSFGIRFALPSHRPDRWQYRLVAVELLHDRESLFLHFGVGGVYPMARTFMPFRNGNFAPLEDLAREVDSLVQNIFDPEERAQHQPKFTPFANLAETEKGYELTLDLPGINAEEVSVELNDDQLVVTGERKSEVEDGKTYHRVERRCGKFRRVLTIPAPVNEDAITADYKDGVLTVSLPKSEKVKPKKIAIKVN